MMKREFEDISSQWREILDELDPRGELSENQRADDSDALVSKNCGACDSDE